MILWTRCESARSGPLCYHVGVCPSLSCYGRPESSPGEGNPDVRVGRMLTLQVWDAEVGAPGDPVNDLDLKFSLWRRTRA